MYTFDPVGIRENTKTNLKFCNQIFLKKKKIFNKHVYSVQSFQSGKSTIQRNHLKPQITMIFMLMMSEFLTTPAFLVFTNFTVYCFLSYYLRRCTTVGGVNGRKWHPCPKHSQSSTASSSASTDIETRGVIQHN